MEHRSNLPLPARFPRPTFPARLSLPRTHFTRTSPMPQPDDSPAQPASSNTPRPKDDLIEQAVFTLTPFFLDGAGGDPVRARRAAVEMLKVYPINSPLELQLATEF